MTKNPKTQEQFKIHEREGQLVLALNSEILLPENAPVRLTSAQLEELDYRKLYRAYSPRGRKSKVDPRVMFKVMVYGYQCGIYSSRKLEEACKYRIDFRWLLEDENAPDHATIARFRTGRCAEAAEDLFYQYVKFLEKQEETDHKTIFVDGTKMESRAGRYPFCWRGSVEKHLAKVREKVFATVGLKNLTALQEYLKQRKAEKPKEIKLQKTFWELRNKSQENITTERGIYLRMCRSIQVEGTFALLKTDFGFRRFLTRGKANVRTELFFLDMAFNLKKLWMKRENGRLKTHLSEIRVA